MVYKYNYINESPIINDGDNVESAEGSGSLKLV